MLFFLLRQAWLALLQTISFWPFGSFHTHGMTTTSITHHTHTAKEETLTQQRKNWEEREKKFKKKKKRIWVKILRWWLNRAGFWRWVRRMMNRSWRKISESFFDWERGESLFFGEWRNEWNRGKKKDKRKKEILF